jgi:monoamine oxidase
LTADIYDTLIIGAGLAGLAAARELVNGGHRVLIIEARSRVGGRVYSRPDPITGEILELGAEWLDPDGTAAALLNSADAAPVTATGNHWNCEHGRCEKGAEQEAGFEALLEQLRPYPDLALDQALRHCCSGAEWAAQRQELLAYVTGYHAADPEQLSVAWLLDAERNQSAAVAAARSTVGADRGVQALWGRLSESCSLRLNTVVHEICWSAAGVEVHASDAHGPQSFVARRLVSTLPAAVLNAQAVTFTPALPAAKLQALSFIATGPVVKLQLVLDKSFAEIPGAPADALFVFAESEPMPTFWTRRPHPAPVLTGWLAGPRVLELGELTLEQWCDLALTSWVSATGTSRAAVLNVFRSCHWHDWQRDPYALGAYSWIRAGGNSAPAELARPIDGILFFAGEATCSGGLNATMDGAIESGQRAASEILLHLN